MKNPMILIAALATSSLFATASLATPSGNSVRAAYTGHELAGHANVTIAQARATALKARPGVVTDQELEKEKGGSGLRYSFDIKSAGHTYEVGVDAKTGRVLENGAEGANPD